MYNYITIYNTSSYTYNFIYIYIYIYTCIYNYHYNYNCVAIEQSNNYASCGSRGGHAAAAAGKHRAFAWLMWGANRHNIFQTWQQL